MKEITESGLHSAVIQTFRFRFANSVLTPDLRIRFCKVGAQHYEMFQVSEEGEGIHLEKEL